MITGLNKQGHLVMTLSDGQNLNYNFWECDCAHDHVMPAEIPHCLSCGADRDDSPVALDFEVQLHLQKSQLTSAQK